ncbi:hypothetical protein DENSPDRAFT_887290 [Dentipellis sp. KUC8613]|nr:hypothetical protein DENSPDRAFT_887290 [Dentipellis sp. KUC8613]
MLHSSHFPLPCVSVCTISRSPSLLPAHPPTPLDPCAGLLLLNASSYALQRCLGLCRALSNSAVAHSRARGTASSPSRASALPSPTVASRRALVLLPRAAAAPFYASVSLLRPCNVAFPLPSPCCPAALSRAPWGLVVPCGCLVAPDSIVFAPRCIVFAHHHAVFALLPSRALDRLSVPRVALHCRPRLPSNHRCTVISSPHARDTLLCPATPLSRRMDHLAPHPAILRPFAPSFALRPTLFVRHRIMLHPATRCSVLSALFRPSRGPWAVSRPTLSSSRCAAPCRATLHPLLPGRAVFAPCRAILRGMRSHPRALYSRLVHCRRRLTHHRHRLRTPLALSLAALFALTSPHARPHCLACPLRCHLPLPASETHQDAHPMPSRCSVCRRIALNAHPPPCTPSQRLRHLCSTP